MKRTAARAAGAAHEAILQQEVQPMHETAQEERREAPRLPFNANKPLRVEIPIGDYLVPSTVLPHDLSLNGLRGRWETALPETGEFPVYIELGKPVRFTAKVAWQRRLPQDAVLAGLAFTKVSKRAVAALKAYMKGMQQETRRTSVRVEDILPIEVIMADGKKSFTTIASDLSREGLQITNDFALPEEQDLTLLLPLAWEAPMEVTARVRWQKTTAFGGSISGLQFVDPSSEVLQRMDEYITTLRNLQHAPLED
ncbi:MAG: PilZ domain-containing protein [Candidatus Xenobia bacterium]